jgi:hypothetical protein
LSEELYITVNGIKSLFNGSREERDALIRTRRKFAGETLVAFNRASRAEGPAKIEAPRKYLMLLSSEKAYPWNDATDRGCLTRNLLADLLHVVAGL